MEKVQICFEVALAMPVEQRKHYLKDLSDKEPEIYNEVQALIDADSKSKIWETPAQPSSSISYRSLQSGDEIGAYRIVKQIGEGGMGVIYRAEDQKLQRHVALKFLPAGQCKDEQFRQRFLSEARAASRLDHPNICVIHDVNETPDGLLFITMPCYEGETLTKRISRGPLQHDDAIDIAICVAEGLASAHQHNIVHRDIKPSNIMLTQDGGVKVLDFGIAKVENSDLTGTGISIGTLSYMSPEQLRGEAVDARTDVWALGAVFYEMLLGKQAFPAKALPDVIQAVLNQEYSELDSVQLPGAILQVLQRALARDAQQRFASMLELCDSLKELKRLITRSSGNTENLQQENDLTMLQMPVRQKKIKSYEWDESLLEQITELLLPALGPIAGIMVRRKAALAEDLEQLKTMLAGTITDKKSREDFQRQIQTQISAFTSPPVPQALKTSGTVAGIELSQLQLSELETELIDTLGPITQTLVRRHAQNASSISQLIETLSRHIDDENAGKAFVEKMLGKYSQE